MNLISGRASVSSRNSLMRVHWKPPIAYSGLFWQNCRKAAFRSEPCNAGNSPAKTTDSASRKRKSASKPGTRKESGAAFMRSSMNCGETGDRLWKRGNGRSGIGSGTEFHAVFSARSNGHRSSATNSWTKWIIIRMNTSTDSPEKASTDYG